MSFCITSYIGTWFSKLLCKLWRNKNRGVELAVQASLVRTRDFEWIIGGNIARNESEVKSLGSTSQLINSYSDGAQLVSRVGESPYQFYGYQTLGVFSTQAEADAANLVNQKGQAYQAGDIHFVDQNGDGRIDSKDRVSLGSAAPKYFGGFLHESVINLLHCLQNSLIQRGIRLIMV